MKKIAEQYNDYIYPKPITNMQKAISEDGYVDISNADLFWEKFYPEKEYKNSLNVFIAGCGTNQPIYFGLSNPNWNIYAIDLSENSIAYVKEKLIENNIKNVQIEKQNILDTNFKNEFDLVISTGVIHHTKEPKTTLTKLVDATSGDGALSIMVYANYLRRGVYDLQKIFRHLKIEQNKEGIEFAKNYIENIIPKYHEAKRYYLAQKDNYDSGIIDTWLNPQDIAYSALEISDLISDTGAYFQGWFDNVFCYPNAILYGVEVNFKLLDDLNPLEATDFTQSHILQAGKHEFILRKKKEFENLWHNISNIKETIKVKSSAFLLFSKELDLSQKLGGQLMYLRHNSLLSAPFDLKEGIIWRIVYEVSQKNESIEIHKLEEKCNEFSKNNNLGMTFDINELKQILHKMWKQEIVTFSMQ